MPPIQKAKTIDFKLSSFSKEELISAGLHVAFELDLPIAVWRMPQESEIRLIISTENAKTLDKLDLEELPAGFAVAPFHFGTESCQYIEAQFCLSFDFEEVVNESSVENNEDSDKLERINYHFKDCLASIASSKDYHVNPKRKAESSVDYQQLVQKSIDAIEAGQLDKVVPARSKTIGLPEDFNPIELLLDLCENYPNAFVSLVSIPKKGTWIGATPEILIEKTHSTFKTIALAGTQKLNKHQTLGDTSWTQKEIEEQAMVSRYIINCFKKIRLREFNEAGPKTIQAGNLLHLKTTYSVNTEETNFPELATVMLELLHPTSAIAGMPKQAAMSFLNAYEGLDREFFSGFLGPVNLDHRTNLFVNLRCMQLFEKEAKLYAGAGITSDSNPEKEYQETEMKFKTLLNILNKQF